MAAPPPLEAGDVHVWVARLERNGRAERRAVLGAIVSGYAGGDVRRPELRSAPNGKTEPVQLPGAATLELNSSASAELAVYAVACGRRVGVDVERVRAVRDPVELARAVLSEHERTAIAAMPERRRHRTFLERWVQTEAYLKARGTGLAGLGEAPSTEETWSVRALALGSEYVGAVVAEGVGWTLRYLQW